MNVWIGKSALVGAVALVSMVGPAPAGASSAVHDLATAALNKSDVPGPYVVRKMKLFHSYKRSMRPGTGAGSCGRTPAPITAGSWREGLAVSLATADHNRLVRECAYLVQSSSTATSAYASLRRTVLTQMQLAGTVTSTATVHVGDQSVEYSVSSTVTARAILFRHSNAVVLLVARSDSGAQAISAPRLVQIARAINSRL